MNNREGRPPGSVTALDISDTRSDECYGKTPQEKKRTKTLADFKKLTGVELSGGPLADEWAEAIQDAISTGARTVNPEKEDSHIECNAEWHFVRFRGTGKNLVPILYGISWHLGGESGSFHLSMKKLERFLDVKNHDELYAAAHLLVVSGFWEVVEAEIGKPVKYRPVGHKEWAERHARRCTKKMEYNFTQEDESLANLGRSLGAILGGEKFFLNVVRGYRAAAIGLTDDQILEQAKAFMAADRNKGSGKGRRKRFTEYLKKTASDLPQNPG